MKFDLIIRGGHVIDTARGIDGPEDVFIRKNKIVSLPKGETIEADQIIEAAGCLVVPGLIDNHVHLYYGATELSVIPDIIFPPMGVTTAVDAGSAGTGNYALLSRCVIQNSTIRIKTLLNVSPTGLTTLKYHEIVDPKYFDTEKIFELLESYPDEILGLKVRASKPIVGELGMAPLLETIKIAEQADKPVVVHTTNPPVGMDIMAAALRPGDIFAHVFHGTGNTIIDASSKVLKGIRTAQERGVIFDAANGRNHFGFKVATAAINDGFYPDIISTDISIFTMFRPPVVGLPYIMSKYLNLGIPIKEVFRATTETPAKWMKMGDVIGNLAPGANADVAIFRLVDKETQFADTNGERLVGQKLLVPQATIFAGRVIFRQLDF